ncbi:MAG: hypothetical protein V4660_06160 [Pseudomonadota bacterium]
MNKELQESWKVTRRHLAASRFYLQENFLFEEAIEYEKEFNEYMHANEFGLALESVEMLGTISNAPSQFWAELQLAALNMGRNEDFNRFLLLAVT